MRQRRKRVYAYITNQGRLLVFAHPNSQSAGIQVPAGTVEPGEDPDHAVLREAEEETGLSDLDHGAFLGKLERDMREFGTDEIQEAWFYHLTCPGTPPQSWSHDETSGGRVDPIQFDFFWVSLPDGLPELIALNGAMLDELYEAMGQSQDEVNIPGSTSALETDRLILRAFRLSDQEAVCSVFGDAEVMKFGIGVQSEQWVQEWLAKCIETYGQTPGYGPLAVVLKECREIIGYCGLIQYPDVNGQPETEIGYRLIRAHWGRGYGTEAVSAVRDFGFERVGLRRLVAMIDPHNTASIRVAEKVGMRYEQDVMLEGYTHPDGVYSVERVAPR